MSFVEIAAPMLFDQNVFDKLYSTAIKTLEQSNPQKNTQVIIVFTSKDNEYSTVISNVLSKDGSEEKMLLDVMAESKDTCIRYIMCVWHNGAIDLPSYRFRKMLVEFNPANGDAGIFIKTRDAYGIIKLSNTLKD